MTTENVTFAPQFVNLRNVARFKTTVDALLHARSKSGDERLGCVYGRAGRGKTRTVQAWASEHGAVYLETVRCWSELDFLKALCRELGILHPPGRRGAAFAEAVEALVREPRVVFIDELERFGQGFLEIVRDLAKISGGVVVLIGEEELPHLMKQNRRVWSRTYQAMEFEPVNGVDIVYYVGQTTGMKLSAEAVGVLLKASSGDLRIVRRDTINLVHVANSMGRFGEVTAETAEIAVRRGLQGGVK